MKALSLAAAAALSALFVVGCSSGGNGTTSPSPSSGGAANTPAPNAVVITITSTNGAQSFTPNPATLQSGQQIVFRNADSAAHRIVLDNGGIDTGVLAAGQSSTAMTWTGSAAQYHCTIHPTMIGSINEPTGAPPASSGDPTY